MTGLLAALTACSPAKYVPKESHLLGKNQVEITGKNITADQVNGYVIQKPNKKDPWFAVPSVSLQPFKP